MLAKLGVGEDLPTELQTVLVLLALVATLQGNKVEGEWLGDSILFEAHHNVSRPNGFARWNNVHRRHENDSRQSFWKLRPPSAAASGCCPPCHVPHTAEITIIESLLMLHTTGEGSRTYQKPYFPFSSRGYAEDCRRQNYRFELHVACIIACV